MSGRQGPDDASDQPSATYRCRAGHPQQQSPAEASRIEGKVEKVETAISLVLRLGVMLSVLVLVVGLGLMFAHHSGYLPITGHFSYRELTSRATPFPHTFGSLARSLARGEGQGVVVLGVLLLILTPVLRVAVGVLSFLYENDRAMTIVTLYVLAVLVGSFFLANV